MSNNSLLILGCQRLAKSPRCCARIRLLPVQPCLGLHCLAGREVGTLRIDWSGVGQVGQTDRSRLLSSHWLGGVNLGCGCGAADYSTG